MQCVVFVQEGHGGSNYLEQMKRGSKNSSAFFNTSRGRQYNSSRVMADREKHLDPPSHKTRQKNTGTTQGSGSAQAQSEHHTTRAAFIKTRTRHNQKARQTRKGIDRDGV